MLSYDLLRQITADIVVVASKGRVSKSDLTNELNCDYDLIRKEA